MSLSVVSALARLGVDPWREAARLAVLPKASAADALAGMIGKLSADTERRFDAMACATRLIELLPRAAAPLVRRRRFISVSELCLILALAALGATLGYRILFADAEAPATTISSSAPRSQ